VRAIPATAVAAALLLSGCPLPQPLPEYSKGTVTPPRIVMDGLALPDTLVQVPAGCAAGPSYPLAAKLIDTNTTEAVTARWFVDYDPQNSSRCSPAQPQSVIPAPSTGSDPTVRDVPAYVFAPYDHPSPVGGASGGAAGVVHVVELVVSNNFDPAADDNALCKPDSAISRPYRTPASETGGVQFETQSFRWVFLTVSGVPCPPGP
jgi:hypothetical protein